MKRIIKSIALILVVIIICLSFCSCSQLDEARQSQAFFSQNEDGIIYFREKAYKPLPECDDLNVSTTLSGRVTEHDVPVLLKNTYGDTFFYSEDLNFLRYGGNNYCISELYNEYVNKISNYKLDNYCVEDNFFDYEKNEMVFEHTILSEQAKNALEDIFNNFEASKLIGNEVFSKSILLCDENLEFTRYYARLINTTDGIYVATDDKYYDGIYYKLTEEYTKILYPYLIDKNNVNLYPQDVATTSQYVTVN